MNCSVLSTPTLYQHHRNGGEEGGRQDWGEQEMRRLPRHLTSFTRITEERPAGGLTVMPLASCHKSCKVPNENNSCQSLFYFEGREKGLVTWDLLRYLWDVDSISHEKTTPWGAVSHGILGDGRNILWRFLLSPESWLKGPANLESKITWILLPSFYSHFLVPMPSKRFRFY